jgi:lipopolysaccharide export system permease protein
MSIFLLAFNDQVLPRANHRLKTLQDDISQTKPSLLLKPQVINAVSEGKLYLKAGRIDQGTGKMREVVIYDLADPTRRRTIYADSGSISLAANGRDMEMELHHGQMQLVETERPGQLDRLFYRHDLITIRDVAKDFEKSKSTMENRGDRELGVCAMQKRLRIANASYLEAKADYEETIRLAKLPKSERPAKPVHRPPRAPQEPHNIAYLYCHVLARLIGVKKAEAAEVRGAGLHQSVQDTVPKRATQDSVAKIVVQDTAARRMAQDSAVKRDSVRKAAADSVARAQAASAPPGPGGTVILGTSRPPVPGSPGARPVPVPAQSQQVPAPGTIPPPVPGTVPAPSTSTFKDPFLAKSAAESLRAAGKHRADASAEIAENVSRAAENKLRLDTSRRVKNRYEIEIHKKFALAAACLIFVVLGAPLALRFPRGGVGLVLLVSLVVFALYYVGLIGGESLANKGLVPPFWAMWGTNVVLTVVGVVLLFRMGREESSGRGGNWGDRLDRLRDFLNARRGRGAVLVKEVA